MKIMNSESLIWSHQEKLMQQSSPICWNVIAGTQNGTQWFVWPPCDCLHTWQRWGMLLNEMTDSVLRYLLLDPDQGNTELLVSLRWNLMVSDGPKHDVPVIFYWLEARRAWRPVNGINSFILQELPAYSCHMRIGIKKHQEEPRFHCASEGSNNGSKKFIQN